MVKDDRETNPASRRRAYNAWQPGNGRGAGGGVQPPANPKAPPAALDGADADGGKGKDGDKGKGKYGRGKKKWKGGDGAYPGVVPPHT